MKKFVLLLFFTIFFCTSCSIEYNISLNKSDYDEDIYLTENHIDYFEKTNDTYKRLINYNKQSVEMELDQPGQIEYFNLDNYFDIFNSGAHLYNTFRLYDEYPLLIYKCYEDYTLDKKDNVILLQTSGKFLCSNFLNNADSVKVNIKSNMDLIETNANEYGNGIYTWNLKNTDDKNLYLKLDIEKNIVIDETNKDNGKFNLVIIIIIIGLSVGLVVVSIFTINYYRKKVNKI